MPVWARKLIDIRKGELEPTMLLFTFWFIVLMVFQVLKPLKKGLFVEALGATTELYAKLGNVVVALLVVVIFTWLYNRLGSARMLAVLCVAFILGLLGFSAAFFRGTPGAFLTWTFYLFGDAWSTVWVTAFWAYLNDLTETEQSKRLYGLIGAGGVMGGLAGNVGVWQLVEPLGAPALLVGSAVLCAVIGLTIWRTEHLAGQAGSPIGRLSHTEVRAAKKSNPAMEGAKIVMTSRYLLAAAAIVLLYEVTSQVLDFQYSKAAEALHGAGATQAFFGKVGTIVGVISVITQLFLVSFVVRTLGLTTALLVLPVAMAVSSGVYFATPVLSAAALLTISDNAFSYSINQTARETLFVPTSPEVKYKARAFINMFLQRSGKAIAILMALGLSSVPVTYLSPLAIGVIAIWVVFALRAGREFESLTRAPAAYPVLSPTPLFQRAGGRRGA